jgi:glycosyltransferase involved in cell wall biosynthesis
MKVLYITTNFPRWDGDAHSPWIVEIIKRLRDRGIVAEVLVPSFQGLRDHTVEGITVYRFRYCLRSWETLTHNEGASNKIRNPLYLLLVPPYIFFGLLRTVALCRAHHYDVIHVHWPLPSGIFGLVGRWMGSRRGGRPVSPRLVASFHGAELLLTRRFPILKPVLSSIIVRCDAVTSNSQFTSDLIRQLADVPVHVIPYGSRIEIKESIRHDERNGVLFVGRLIERKGLPYLLEAIRLVGEKRCVHLDIVGEGNLKPELMKRAAHLGISDRVSFHGRVDDSSLAELYARCSLFVLPAIVDSHGDTEGLGVVLLEAMSYQKPVIATNVGGIPDIIHDGETGLLVEEKNASALAHAIERLLDDPHLGRRLGEQGALFVEERFDWHRIVDEIEALYRGSDMPAPTWHSSKVVTP